MKYLSVCAGIEAATVAWHHMGWEPVAFSEIEKFPSAVLAHHYPNVPNWGDMTKFQEWPDACICGKLSCNYVGGSGSSNDNSGIQPNAKRGRPVFGINSKKGICNECNGTIVDVLVGGTPCQSFSVAGLRKGLDDPRGNLMLTFGAIAQRYRPQWLVWENVPGVLSSNGGRDFGTFLGMLGELGYGFAYRVLDAQFFGVAQRRRRVFVVGCLGNWQRAAAVLFERHSLSGHPAPSRQARKGTAGGVAPSVDERGIQHTVGTLCADTHPGAYSGQDAYTGKLVPQPVAIQGTLIGRGENAGPQGSGADVSGAMFTLTKTDVHAVAFAQNQLGEVRIGEVLNTLNTNSNASGRNTPMVAQPAAWDEELNARTDLAGAMLRGGDGGRHDGVMTTTMQVRRLTPVECERLQGFPDGYTAIPWRNKPADECPDGPRYKALGNSMAVPVMSWIGKRINQVEAL